MTSSTIAIIITVITMILFFINKLPMSVVACISTLAMGILIPEMKLSQIYSGFGGSSIVMVAGMCIVGDALFQTGIAQRIVQRLHLPRLQRMRGCSHSNCYHLYHYERVFIKFRLHCNVDADHRVYCRRFEW